MNPLPRDPDDTLRSLVHEGLEEIEHTESHVVAYALADWLAARGVRLHHTGHAQGLPYSNRGIWYRIGRRLRLFFVGRCFACSSVLTWRGACPYAEGNIRD
jgi:hypothetical protein